MSSERDFASDHRVRLLEGPRRPPRTLAERHALAILTRDGTMALGHLVDLVAGALYHDELRHGGWAADIGLVGRAPFLPEARWAVEEATGVLWRTEPRLSSPIDHPLARP